MVSHEDLFWQTGKRQPSNGYLYVTEDAGEKVLGTRLQRMSFRQHEYVLKKTILLLPTCRECQLTSNCWFPFLLFFIKPKSVGDKLILSILSVLCEEWQTLTRLPLTNFLKHISSSCTLKQLGQKSVFLYFSTAIAGKILVTAKCSITRNAAPPPGTETPVKGTVTMFQLVRC